VSKIPGSDKENIVFIETYDDLVIQSSILWAKDEGGLNRQSHSVD